MIDKRIVKLASNLVNYSCSLKKGENLLIEAQDIDYMLINEIIKQAKKVGANCFVRTTQSRIRREMLKNLSKEEIDILTKSDVNFFKQMHAYIGIRGNNNDFELAGIDREKMELYEKQYLLEVHHKIRVAKTKWVILRYPTSSFAQLSNMSTEDMEDYYFKVCNLDYMKMDKAMDNLVKLMNSTDKVKIVSNNTNLEFSIKNIPAIKCSGKCNIPDGEVYTAPVKDSVNGTISYNCPTIYSGVRHNDVKLTFKDGKIIEATSSNTKHLNQILDTDNGARYIGEFAIGVNPHINDPICDILFDEKISGSIHFTPGASYDDAFNGNKSAVHWDLVLIQTEQHGGGQIFFDDILIRNNGVFVKEELLGLNPENLV